MLYNISCLRRFLQNHLIHLYIKIRSQMISKREKINKWSMTTVLFWISHLVLPPIIAILINTQIVYIFCLPHSRYSFCRFNAYVFRDPLFLIWRKRGDCDYKTFCPRKTNTQLNVITYGIAIDIERHSPLRSMLVDTSSTIT